MSAGEHNGRREFLKLAGASAAGVALAPVSRMVAQSAKSGLKANGPEVHVTKFGAVGDGKTLNTEKIQAAIDHLAGARGGTLVIPEGVFLSGAIFLKPGVHLRLEKGGVLKGSTNIADYPMRKTRIEGHFQVWTPALLNADGCDGLRVYGEGTLDGSGAPFWKEFWDRRAADHKTANLDVPRPRLAFIENSHDVQLHGLTFKDSGFWNLHIYRCQHVLVENMRFEVPDGQRCPSTDGTDIDSCQDVTVRGCYYRVDDDGVCLKGSKGPFALQDKDSPPVERIIVENCTFERSGGVVTLGSEATVVRDVTVRHCKAMNHVPVVHLKLRPDTPQLYENVHFSDITVQAAPDGKGGRLFEVSPWRQYFDLKGQPPPKSTVRNISLSNVKGTYGSFGMIEGTPGQTVLTDFTIKDVDVQLQDPTLKVSDVTGLKIDNVKVNGKPLEVTKA